MWKLQFTSSKKGQTNITKEAKSKEKQKLNAIC